MSMNLYGVSFGNSIVVASDLKIWSIGNGKTLTRKEVKTLKSLGLPVTATCSIKQDGFLYKGTSKLNIQVVRKDLDAKVDPKQMYRIYYV